MNTKLITALNAAADALENGTFQYDWKQPHRCNCGVVAAALLGKTQSQIDKMLPQTGSMSWAGMISRFCPVTGMPRRAIFRQLLESGMTTKDMVDLEWLRNPKVLEKCNFGTETSTHTTGFWWWKKTHSSEIPVEPQKDHRQHVIKYLRAWAALLSEEGDEFQIEQVQPRTTQLSAQPNFSRS